MVGTFGVSGWDLNLKNTWKMKPSDTTHAAQEANKIVQNATPPPPHRFINKYIHFLYF